jgi:AI-2 transport protein TqsA
LKNIFIFIQNKFPDPMKQLTQYLIAAAAIVIVIAGLKLGAGIINQILLAFLLSICIIPLPIWLTKKGLPKGLSITISMIVILAGGFLITMLLANSIASLADSFPVYQEKFSGIYKNFLDYAAANNIDLGKLVSQANVTPEKLVNIGSKLLSSLTSFISSSFIIAMLMAFMVIELINYSVDTRKGKRGQSIHIDWLTGLSGDLRKYVTITALKGVITGVLNFILLIILGVDFAFLWAFFSFLMNFIPNLGFIFSFLPPALIALIMLGPWQALIVFIGFWLINAIVENVIGPIFLKETLNISLLTTFLSLLVWGWILGMTGAVLGVPLTMVVMKIYSDFKDKGNLSVS